MFFFQVTCFFGRGSSHKPHGNHDIPAGRLKSGTKFGRLEFFQRGMESLAQIRIFCWQWLGYTHLQYTYMYIWIHILHLILLLDDMRWYMMNIYLMPSITIFFWVEAFGLRTGQYRIKYKVVMGVIKPWTEHGKKWMKMEHRLRLFCSFCLHLFNGQPCLE